MRPELPVHGGNLVAVAKRYGVDSANLLDFSANINPAGPPQAVRDAIARETSSETLAHYPDPSALPLREKLGDYLAIDPDSIAIGNGAAALLDAAIRAFAPASCLLPVPAFSEYRRALDAGRCDVGTCAFEFEAIAAALERENVDLLVLNTPHNPTGALLARARVEELIERSQRRQTAIVIDEAFIDYAPEETCLARALAYDRAVVVRSLTKFYGMPGIRIGYAIGSRAAALRAVLPSWPVGAIEISAATAALDEGDYAKLTRERNSSARAALAEDLAAIGIDVAPSQANFLFLRLPCSPAIMDALLGRLIAEHGIVVRDCRNYDGLATSSAIRVAVRTPADNARLAGALRALLSSDLPISGNLTP